MCVLQAEAHGDCRVDALHQFAVHAPHALAQPPLVERSDLLEQHHAVARQTVVRRGERDMRRQVMAAAITVGLYRLPVSFCTMSTGRTPPCSLPTTGERSA